MLGFLSSIVLGTDWTTVLAQALAPQREYQPVIVEGFRLAQWKDVVQGTNLTVQVYQNGQFVNIPFQLDKRRRIHVNFNVGSSDPGYLPENCELGYFQELYDGPPPPSPPQGPRADFDDDTLRYWDEIVLLMKDASLGTTRVPTSTWLDDVGVTGERFEVVVTDPRTAAKRYVYVHRWESEPPSTRIDSTDYVQFTVDDRPPENPCESEDRACGWFESRNVPGLSGVATLDVHFDGNWITNGIRTKDTGTSPANPDFLQRFRYTAGAETENSWTTGGRPRFLGIKDGQVRVVRAVQGAQSGRRTTKYEFLYPSMFQTRVNLRVHDLPGLTAALNHEDGMATEGQDPQRRGFVWSKAWFDDNAPPSNQTRYLDGINGVCPNLEVCGESGLEYSDWVQMNSPERGSYIHVFTDSRRPIPVLSMNRTGRYVDADQGQDAEIGKHGRRWTSLACTEDGPPDNDGACSDPEGEGPGVYFARLETFVFPRHLQGNADDPGQVVAEDFQLNLLSPIQIEAVLQRKDEASPEPGPACAPTIHASDPQDGSVSLARTPSGPCGNTIGTRFFRSEGGRPFWIVKDLRSGSSFTDAMTLPGVEYQYKAVSYNSENVETAWSSTVTITPTDTNPPPTPAAPIGFGGDGSVTLEQTAPCTRDLAGLNFFISASPGGPYSKVNETPISPVTRPMQWTKTGLQNGWTYYFVVTSVDFSGNESSYSSEVAVQAGP